MRISFVIPSYNMSEYLAHTLDSLAVQNVDSDLFEVIVSDDGSPDATSSVAASRSSRFARFHYRFRPRDALSCRSRARNTGLEVASGAWALFLDSGVVVPPTFVGEVLRITEGDCADVLAFETLGLFASCESFRHSDLGDPFMARVREREDYGDKRMPLLERVEGDLARYPAPWLLAWTCALAVRRTAAVSIDGFDATFQNWGAEDVDFALRLHQAGATFGFVPNQCVVHLPHGVPEGEDRKQQHQSNLEKLHAKHQIIGTELFALTADAFGPNFLLERLDRLQLSLCLPPWPIEVREALRSRFAHAGRTLAVGVRAVDLGEALPTVQLVHNERGRQERRKAMRPLLGCKLPFSDQSFVRVVVTDFIRLLPRAVRAAQLRELARVAECVELWITWERSQDQIGNLYREYEGWHWPSFEELMSEASAACLSEAEATRDLGPVRVAVLRRGPPMGSG